MYSSLLRLPRGDSVYHLFSNQRFLVRDVPDNFDLSTYFDKYSNSPNVAQPSMGVRNFIPHLSVRSKSDEENEDRKRVRRPVFIDWRRTPYHIISYHFIFISFFMTKELHGHYPRRQLQTHIADIKRLTNRKPVDVLYTEIDGRSQTGGSRPRTSASNLCTVDLIIHH